MIQCTYLEISNFNINELFTSVYVKNCTKVLDICQQLPIFHHFKTIVLEINCVHYGC